MNLDAYKLTNTFNYIEKLDKGVFAAQFTENKTKTKRRIDLQKIAPNISKLKLYDKYVIK